MSVLYHITIKIAFILLYLYASNTCYLYIFLFFFPDGRYGFSDDITDNIFLIDAIHYQRTADSNSFHDGIGHKNITQFLDWCFCEI